MIYAGFGNTALVAYIKEESGAAWELLENKKPSNPET
jgi:hypothetical protein